MFITQILGINYWLNIGPKKDMMKKEIIIDIMIKAKNEPQASDTDNYTDDFDHIKIVNLIIDIIKDKHFHTMERLAKVIFLSLQDLLSNSIIEITVMEKRVPIEYVSGGIKFTYIGEYQ